MHMWRIPNETKRVGMVFSLHMVVRVSESKLERRGEAIRRTWD